MRLKRILELTCRVSALYWKKALRKAREVKDYKNRDPIRFVVNSPFGSVTWFRE
jgi:hypothetical protein